MLKPKNILLIGTDVIDMLWLKNHFDLDIQIAANYEEAAELLKDTKFSLVITDAALPERKSGLHVLRLIENKRKKGELLKPETQIVVCHRSPICQLGKRTWIIEQSLGVHYPNDKFHKGTIASFLNEITPSHQACA